MLLREFCARFKEPLVVCDPFCGNGVLLAGAYLFFNERIPRLLGSELDAGDLGDVFARIHPPYDGPQALATFLGQAAQTDGRALLLAYRPGVDLLPLLKQHFEAHALNGTRGRSLYCCLPKP
ncbi:MAG: hypothetical protein QGH25_03100 [Candidatus Latescibacteria bacterium]|nr:hypothetical protein [Candidatus Latescibacterota bacterium]